MEIRDGVSYSLPQKTKRFFRGGKKLSRNMWLSIDDEKKDEKNRVLKRCLCLENRSLISTKINFDTIPENELVGVSYALTSSRGSICEEIEKEIFHDGISLYEMRKAIVIEEGLNGVVAFTVIGKNFGSFTAIG